MEQMTMSSRTHSTVTTLRADQRGVTTLAITIILLVIVTLMVLFAANVGYFDLRTTNNKNRSEITEQLAEYALNLSGEFLKANRTRIINKTGTGWLVTGGTGPGWVRCPAGAIAASHPCAAERFQARREQMYYFDNNRATGPIDPVPYTTVAGAQTGALTGVGTTRFAGTVTVNALLCLIGFDLTNPASPIPRCEASPANGSGNVAVTLVADAALTGEGSSATLKETWATVGQVNPMAAVPLIASGLVQGLGNAQIVAAPNAGGFGLAASMWSPNNIDIGSTGSCGGGGVGSVSTCHIGEFLKSTPRSELKTTCATVNNACGCPSVTASGTDFLSGHSGATRREGLDILDRDGNCGDVPDITFFPREPWDRPTDPTDDSVFEYIFGVDYVVSEGSTTVNTNCGTTGTQNCADFAMLEDFGATQLANCSSLNTSSSGIFYVKGNCDVNDIGSATSPVIVVVDGNVSINGNRTFFGMLFVRSNNDSAQVTGTGNFKIFGSLVIEGNINLTGSIDIVYDSTAASTNPNELPASARFGKVSGSWLDSRAGI
jgi:hypothetical protein